MGQDKATALWRGEALAARAARVLSEAGCAPVALVGTQPELDALGWPRVAELEQGRLHPLYGVAAALDAARGAPLALLCPCDLPLLMPEHIAALLAAAQPCVARAAGHIHPLLALLPPELAPRARALAEAGAGAHALTGGLLPVDLTDSALTDINTAADLASAAALR